MTIQSKPKHGFLLGKFMPPHQGHVFLCEFAKNYCEHLTILVGTMPNEPIDGFTRYKWMRELFPSCDVIWCPLVLPQEPAEDPENFWDIWRTTIQRYTARDTYDVVFASEDYGHRLAHELGASFVPVDPVRNARAVSGTAIRADPFKHWDYIPGVVRPYYVKRVVLFGPESTGKTTLGMQLAHKFNTVYVPEYGRTYTETFGANVNAQDLKNIVSGHIASVSAAKRQANKILIEDTDPVLTGVWSDMLLNTRDPWFATYKDYGSLYLLTDVDIPWVNDGTRYFDDDVTRKMFFDICEQELIARGVKYVRISGDQDKRLRKATKAIVKLLK